MVDNNFAYFLKKFGDPFASKLIPETVCRSYRDKLPRQIFTYWTVVGASGFADGLVWMTNPEEYQPILDRWIAGTEFETRTGLSVIARSAFGELFVWEQRKGNVLTIDPLSGAIFHYLRNENRLDDDGEDEKMQFFWAFMKKEDLDYSDEDDRPLFDQAKRTLGIIDRHHMYGFSHMLPLGGTASIENLDVVDIGTYHDLSRQMNLPDVVRIN